MNTIVNDMDQHLMCNVQTIYLKTNFGESIDIITFVHHYKNGLVDSTNT